MNASIEIQLFHMKREGKPFDVDKYYRAILTGSGDDYNEQVMMLPSLNPFGASRGGSVVSKLMAAWGRKNRKL